MRARHVLQLSGLLVFMGCAPVEPWFTCERDEPEERTTSGGGGCGYTGVDLTFSGRNPTEEDTDEMFVPQGAAGDDDDSAGDDDDSAGGDDVYAALTFELALSLETLPPGDDDDSADAPSGFVEASGSFVVNYWLDRDATEALCRQEMRWVGEAALGPGSTPGCALCTTSLLIEDASDVSTGPGSCDPELLQSDGDFGQQALNVGEGLTRMAFLPAGETEGWSLAGGLGGEELAALLLPSSLQFSHVGYVQRDNEPLPALADFTNSGDSTDGWAPLWVMGAEVGTDADAPLMQGDYAGVGILGAR